MRDTSDSSLWLCILLAKLSTIRKPLYLTKLLSYLPALYPQLYPSISADSASSVSSKVEINQVESMIEGSESAQSSTAADQNDTANSVIDTEEGVKQEEDNSVDEMDSDDNLGSELSFLYSCLSMHSIPDSAVALVYASIPSFVHSQPFPHQILALSWMLNREGSLPDSFSPSSPTLHPLFSVWPPDPTLFISPWTAVFTREFIPNVVIRKGGVLCDTMGLGKTFEMILLILMHPRDSQPLLKKEGTVDSGIRELQSEYEPMHLCVRRSQRKRAKEHQDEDFSMDSEVSGPMKRAKYGQYDMGNDIKGIHG